MKRLYFLLIALICLVACTEDYDSFGTSDYNTLKNIEFENQDSDVLIYEDEHIVKVTLKQLDSLEKWDSVTLASVGVSHFACIRLVKGKFKEFPTDSTALDSLANSVAVGEKLDVGDKIRIPESHVFYFVVESESGNRSIWRVELTIPNQEPEKEDSSDDENHSSDDDKKGDDKNSDDDEKNGKGDSSSSGDSAKSSSSSGDDSSSSIEVSSSSVSLNSNTNFVISFKDQVDSKTSGDTITIFFPLNYGKDSLKVADVVVHEKSSVDVDAKNIKDWSKVQKFVVTAEDKSTKTWYVLLSIPLSSETNFSIKFKNQLKQSKSENVLKVKLENGTELGSAVVDTFYVSEGASVSPSPEGLKTWKDSTVFTVTAADGSKQEWLVVLEVADADEAPASTEKEIVSISAKDEIEKATMDEKQKTVVFHLANKEALSSVLISVAVSENAYIDFDQAKPVDLRYGKRMIITAEDGSTVEWNLMGDYKKLTGNDIKTFSLSDFAGVSVEVDEAKKNISFELPHGTDLSKIYFVANLSEGASIVSPKSATESMPYLELSSKQAVVEVSAEDGSVAKWSVVVDFIKYSGSSITSFKLDNLRDVKASIDEGSKKISFEVPYGTDLSRVTFTATLSDGASITSPSSAAANGGSYLDLSSNTASIEVTAEDGSKSNWTVEVSVQTVAPKITSISLGGVAALIDNENSRILVNNLPFNITSSYSAKSSDITDLTRVEVTSLETSEGASANVSVGSILDVSFGTATITVANGSESKTYKVKGGYQYPNSDFSNWKNGSDGYTQLDGWDNGNNSFSSGLAAKATDEGRTVNKMTSVTVNVVVVEKFAGGNSFTADFNPNNVKAINMASYDDGNELIDFGKPFAGRPEYIEFDAKYVGKGDSCDMYIILENRSGGPDVTNKNRNGSVNKMVASAWYRATSITNSPNRPVPDLVSVGQIERSGYSTVRLKLQYGAPLNNSPIFNSRVLNTVATSLKHKDGIDNRLTPIEASEAETLPVTHIRIVIASSAKGNEYKGVTGATLYVDEIRLIY